MANINKIRLSGQTYDIQDPNASKTVELTQAQYDALTVKDPNTFYIITDATAGDLSNYYTKTEVNTALASKQTTLTAGTGISIVDNVISATGGGGKAIVGGRGIDVRSGETADTVSFNLPISAGTGTDSIRVGGNVTASGTRSAAFGNNCSAKGTNSFAINQSTANGQDSFSQGNSYAEKYVSAAFGLLNYSKNDSELSCGQYNNSVSASTTFGDSGNTLFSVGNGTANNARHNAFEIRQNGDIYCSDGTNDVKLQDTITATAANTTALGGLKLVKLTQSEYDALTTKDDNTVYFIGDSTNGYTMKIGSANVN